MTLLQDLAIDIKHVARTTARQHPVVNDGDVRAELVRYVTGDGVKPLERRIARNDWDGVMVILRAVARQYAERAKAKANGYNFEDVVWYSPGLVATLVPLAVDPTFDGQAGGVTDSEDAKSAGLDREHGNLLAAVIDVRRALKARPDARHVLQFESPQSDRYDSALRALSEWLGGAFPAVPGRDNRVEAV